MAEKFRSIHRKKRVSYYVGQGLLKAMGWTFKQDVAPQDQYKKFVIIAAPHTSNWDLPLMLACSYISGLRISWLGKHTLFRSVGRPFFSWLGGVPVDRTAAKGMVAQVVDVFNEREELAIAVPPEGTRGYTDGWKTGFYYIAHGAGVPIVMSFLDFKTKTAGFGPAVMPSGDIEADFEIFREFYAPCEGKFPERTAPIQIRQKREYVAPKEKEGTFNIIADSIRSMLPDGKKK